MLILIFFQRKNAGVPRGFHWHQGICPTGIILFLYLFYTVSSEVRGGQRRLQADQKPVVIDPLTGEVFEYDFIWEKPDYRVKIIDTPLKSYPMLMTDLVAIQDCFCNCRGG